MMALMTWNEKYTLSGESMDDQHAGLFDVLNELHAAMIGGQAQTLTGPLLKKLVDSTRTTFTAEEATMAGTNYPGLGEHRAVHEDLVNHVAGYARRFERGEIMMNSHLLNFLRDWLVNHIEKTDDEYGPWAREHGVG